MRNHYIDWFVYGKFDLPVIELPHKVWGASYTHNDETIMTLWNDSGKDFVIPTGKDRGRILKTGDVGVYYV